MLVLNLACESGHLFEGWFASAEDCASQQRLGQLRCPLCGSPQVQRRPSAPHLNVSHLKATPATPTSAGAGQGGAVETSTAGPSAPASERREGPPPVTAESAEVLQQIQSLQARYLRLSRELARKAEDVGDRFAAEARRIHEGDAEERLIRGRSSPAEVRDLIEEGIPLMPLVLPEGGDGDLH